MTGDVDDLLEELGDNPAENPENPAEPSDPSAEGAEAGAELDRADQDDDGSWRSAPRRQYDWPTIKRRYVEGVPGEDGTIEWPSLDAVAAHFSANPGWLRTMAAKEGWRAQRTQWQAQVEATRRHARAAALSRSATEIDGSALDSARLGLGLVKARLAEIAAKRDVIPVDAGEQQKLASAADLWHKIGLRAVGDPEVARLEITGAGGAPIEIAAELRRDDSERLAGVLGVLQAAGVGDLFSREDVERQIIEGTATEDS